MRLCHLLPATLRRHAARLRLRRPGDGGNAVVEAALIAPVLVLLLVAVVDVGRAINARVLLDDAARTAIQVALDDPEDTATILQAASAAMDGGPLGTFASGVDSASLAATVEQFCECVSGERVDCGASCPGAGGAARNVVAVTVGGDYASLIPYPGIARPTRLSAQATFRLP